MSLSNKPQSIRFGKSLLWNFNHQIPATNLRKIKTFSPFLQPYVSKFVVNYFIGLVRALFIREWCLPKVSGIKYRKKLWKVPITVGRHSIQLSSKKIIISINLFLDTRNFHKKNLADSDFLIKSAQKTLSTFFNCKVVINYINYFKLYLEAAVSPKPFRSYLRYSAHKRYVTPHTINLDKIREYSFYIQIRRDYNKLKYSLKKFSYNRYFPRIFNIFFASFQNKKFDPWLIVNAISFEISNLRKRHAPFIKFVFSTVKLFFKKFKRKFNLKGLKLQFKGRMVPFNREHPRSLLKVIRLGCMNSSTVNIKAYQADVKSASRFGAVFISLTVSQSKFKFSPVLLNSSFLLGNFYKFNKICMAGKFDEYELNSNVLKPIHSFHLKTISNLVCRARLSAKYLYFIKSFIFDKLLIKNIFFRKIFRRRKIKPKIRYFLVYVLYYAILNNLKKTLYFSNYLKFYYLNNSMVFWRNFNHLLLTIFESRSSTLKFKKSTLINSSFSGVILFKIFKFNFFNEKNPEFYLFFIKTLIIMLTKWLSGLFLFTNYCISDPDKITVPFNRSIYKAFNQSLKLNRSTLFSLQNNKIKQLSNYSQIYNLTLVKNLKLSSLSIVSGGSYFLKTGEILNCFRQYIQLIMQFIFQSYLKDDLTDKYIFRLLSVFLFFHYKNIDNVRSSGRLYKFERLRFKVESFWSPFSKSAMDDYSNYLSHNIKKNVINSYFSVTNKKSKYLHF